MPLHWVIPGLFGPPGRQGSPGAVAARFPLLERVLARADRSGAPNDLEGVLFNLFGIAHDDGRVGSASLCYLADTGRLPDAWVDHADPVHLRADQDRLLLFAGGDLNLEGEEARRIIERLNTHFGADRLRFEAPVADRWYVHADGVPDIRFTALDEVAGRNIDSYLPQGADQRAWRRYLNEIQMLLHDVDTNVARESRGNLAINGVWFSGGGRVPTRCAPRVQAACGASPLLQGLCALTKVAYQAPLVLPVERPAGDQLRLELAPWRALVNADSAAWRTALDGIEAVLGASKSPDGLRIYPCDGRVFDYRPKMRFRIWRKAGPLPAWSDQTL